MNINIKKIIISISLILITLFVNLTPVYASSSNDVLDTLPDGKEDGSIHNYNVFNGNIIPFYVDLDTGIGWYYTGYVPEINMGTLDNFENINTSGGGSFKNFKNYLVNWEDHDNPIDLLYTSQKTCWFYYNGEYLQMYANGSGNKFKGNQVHNLQSFLYGIDGSKQGYDLIVDDLNNNNYTLTNFVWTLDTTFRRYDVQWGGKCYGSYPGYLRGLTSSSVNIHSSQNYVLNGYFYYPAYFYKEDGKIKNDPDYYFPKTEEEHSSWDFSQVSKLITGSRFYDNGDMSLTKLKMNYIDSDKDGIYTTYDSIQVNFFRYTYNDIYEIGDDAYMLFYFDIYDTSTDRYERIYLTDVQLQNNCGAIFNNYSYFTCEIQRILKNSAFYEAGLDNLQILGIGASWCVDDPDCSSLAYGVPYVTLSYGKKMSNHQYMVLHYYEESKNNLIPGSITTYSLLTGSYYWEQLKVETPQNEYGNSIIDGIDPDNFVDEESQGFFNTISGYLDKFFVAVDNGLNNVVKYSEKAGALIGDVFSILPDELIIMFEISILFVVIVGIYLIFRT